MSIFKTKELWSYSNANSETYTTRSLAFYPSENILPSKFKTSLIFTASVEGNLRLFHAVLQESNSDGLLLELDLKLPILQIEVGKFSRYFFKISRVSHFFHIESHFFSVVVMVPKSLCCTLDNYLFTRQSNHQRHLHQKALKDSNSIQFTNTNYLVRLIPCVLEPLVEYRTKITYVFNPQMEP